MQKLKLALYWAASCGGCEIAMLGIGEKILKLVEAADIVFWPAAMDVKYKDVEAMPDKSIDVCLFNGAVRNSEQKHMANLLRQKSTTLIAYGACAYNGGVPGLANLFNRQQILKRIYQETESTDNKNKVFPQTSCRVMEGELTLPEFYDTVQALSKTVNIDYVVPGCPPEEPTTWLALKAILDGQLPPKGTVISSNARAVCDDCPLKRDVKKIKKFYRNYAKIPEPEICLLEQGFLCAGIATRGGCGAPCPRANMPCTGCYGPVENVVDQGANFLSALVSVIDSRDPDEIRRIIDGIPDPIGTLYRYSFPESLLRRSEVQ
jgi:F420-non-reducing hydrogenase small subunit